MKTRHRIVYPQSQLLTTYRTLRAAAQAGRPATALLPIGFAARENGLDVLVRSTESPPDNAPLLEVSLSPRLADFREVPSTNTVAVLAIGQGKELGQARAFIRMENASEVEPVSELFLVGPGMERVALGQPRSLPINEDYWSRTRGARGDEPWRRFTQLHAAVIGCGRMGSAVAALLARSGLRHLTLVDHDSLEAGNIGEMALVTPANIGRTKVEALADAIGGMGLGTIVTPISRSLTSFAALAAVLETDFIVTATDHDSARMAAASLSAIFLKPHFDLGVSVRRQGESRRLAADIRLVWPNRCLRCGGGFNHPDDAAAVLANAEVERLFRVATPRNWQTAERAGSLAALNSAAAGIAITALEFFCDGLLVENGFWVRLEFNERGMPSLRRLVPPTDANCPICALAGAGEAGLEQATKLWVEDQQLVGAS